MSDEIKLNRAKSYGTVFGDPNIGFVQDGFSFRHDGTRLHAPAAAPVDVVAAASPEPTVSISSETDSEAEPEPLSPPNPARSEASRRAWVERRAREVDPGASADA